MSKSQFSRFVQIGRVCLINYGPYTGKLCVILDVIDQNRALISGPTSGVPRQALNFKRMSLTNFRVKINRGSRNKVVSNALAKDKTLEKWEKTTIGKKIASQAKRQNLSDFDRFKVMILKKRRNRVIQEATLKLMRTANKKKISANKMARHQAFVEKSKQKKNELKEKSVVAKRPKTAPGTKNELKTSVEPKPTETKPTETKKKPTKGAPKKEEPAPVETKPAETKPAETKPAETKTAEKKPPVKKGPQKSAPPEEKPAQEEKPAPEEKKPATEKKPAPGAQKKGTTPAEKPAAPATEKKGPPAKQQQVPKSPPPKEELKEEPKSPAQQPEKKAPEKKQPEKKPPPEKKQPEKKPPPEKKGPEKKQQ